VTGPEQPKMQSATPSSSGVRSVAAEHIGGDVYTGDIRKVQLAPGALSAPDDVAVPSAGAWNLPRRPSTVFVGRAAALRELAKVYQPAGRQDATSARAAVGQTISGLGGVGKSELALQYATSRIGPGAVVWWVSAETAEQMDLGLADLAFRLQPAARTAWTTSEAAAWAIDWLQAHTGWLVVLDNVDDVSMVASVLGRLTTGDVLITTRRDIAWHRHGFAIVTLDVLAREASIDLLRDIVLRSRTAQPEAFDETAADALAEELGDLPLALEQAGAYVAQQRTSMPLYLERLKRTPGDLLAKVAEGDDQARAVGQVWSVTLETLERRNPEAVMILRALAWLAPDRLPRSVIAHSRHGNAVRDNHKVSDLLGVLASYSLITLTNQTVSVHRLLQSVLREESQSASDDEPSGRAVALGWLESAWPEGNPSLEVANWPRWRELVPHVEALAGRFPEDAPDLSLAHLLGTVGFFLWVQGRHLDALLMERRSLAITEAEFGPNHPNTAGRLNNLAGTLGALGRHQEALLLQQRVLAITEAQLGPVHPNTVTSLNNLAVTLAALGRHEGVLPQRQRVLAIAEEVFGRDHPNTAASMDNLASTLDALGRHEEALDLRRRALAVTEAVLGPQHPVTGLSLDHLAGTLDALGRHEEALDLRRRALAVTEAVLGPGHPDTAGCLSNLGFTLSVLGRHEEALPLQQRALAIAEEVFGRDHLKTAASIDSLASTLDALGRHEEALDLRRRALAVTEAELGPGHPNTAGRLNELASTLSALGRHEEALPLQERALAIAEAELGSEHPNTGLARENLMHTLTAIGRHEEARD
jgi:tetratricopeptide (TPR) repeat protein